MGASVIQVLRALGTHIVSKPAPAGASEGTLTKDAEQLHQKVLSLFESLSGDFLLESQKLDLMSLLLGIVSTTESLEIQYRPMQCVEHIQVGGRRKCWVALFWLNGCPANHALTVAGNLLSIHCTMN